MYVQARESSQFTNFLGKEISVKCIIMKIKDDLSSKIEKHGIFFKSSNARIEKFKNH